MNLKESLDSLIKQKQQESDVEILKELVDKLEEEQKILNTMINKVNLNNYGNEKEVVELTIQILFILKEMYSHKDLSCSGRLKKGQESDCLVCDIEKLRNKLIDSIDKSTIYMADKFVYPHKPYGL